MMNNELKAIIREFAYMEGLDLTDIKELILSVDPDDDDQEIDLCGSTYRIIAESVINETLREELAADGYALGCFAACAIAEATGIKVEAIERIQECKGYEALGVLIKSKPEWLAALAQSYASTDGYGHHFAHYDHNEHYTGTHYIFRTN